MKINRGLKVVGDIKDRGNIKWTAMMLPEHVEELRKWQEDSDKIKKPVLDEFDYDIMQQEIQRALISQMETRLTCWKDGYLHNHQGIIKEATNRYISYEDSGGPQRLPLDELVGVFVIA